MLLLFGCNKPDPNPHLTDFIYQDIQKKLSGAESLKSTHESNYNDFLSKLKNMDRQSREYWLLSKKSYAAKWEAEKAQQKIDYYKMLLFEREKYVRQSYLKAFTKGEKWDSSEELQLYKKSAQWENSLTLSSKKEKDNRTNP